MKKILWVGDAGCQSGFAVATHQILDTLRQHYDVTVLGINYNGDPHDYPYPIYLAGVGGDALGVRRLLEICRRVKPDVIVLQNDGWHIPAYVQRLQQRLPNNEFAFPEIAKIPVVACVAVDGKNFDREWLRGVTFTIFWTQFAYDEARAGGYGGRAKVVPLGVDLDTYKSMDKTLVRSQQQNGLDEALAGKFVVGNVNRNQPRKRWDLTIKCFAEWITRRNVNDAWLYMHAAPTGDMAVDIIALARYYNCLDRTVYIESGVFQGASEADMCKTYNCFDVLVSTTQGEGMGLPAMEAMACGVPCVLPDWAAFGDWAEGAAQLVPCSSTRVDFPYVNVIGGVVDEGAFIDVLDLLYRNKVVRRRVADQGTARVCEDRFRWQNIGNEYVTIIDALLTDAAVEEQAIDEQPRLREKLLEKRLQILRGEVPA